MPRWLLAIALLCYASLGMGEDGDEEPDPTILGIALSEAVITFDQGVVVSAQKGNPISAKFEMPNGDLLLSVFNATATGLVKTIVDPQTGAIIASEPITDRVDLARAGNQKRLMETARVPLETAIRAAVSDNRDYRAVSITPQQQSTFGGGRCGCCDGRPSKQSRSLSTECGPFRQAPVGEPGVSRHEPTTSGRVGGVSRDRAARTCAAGGYRPVRYEHDGE